MCGLGSFCLFSFHLLKINLCHFAYSKHKYIANNNSLLSYGHLVDTTADSLGVDNEYVDHIWYTIGLPKL